ncbi:hypothetical protein DBB42_04710 [Pseudomonas plecoglossicida]|uniref:site-specific DNA-methyltransferase (adenine-specific) n=1 Tax=Pseudomonas plecoglossicida TaxID=70775 RepID=A0A2R7UML4_PSEDL|nr:N-6 DNA methylase [Pseudomonas plecoglossicida]PTU53387.1 hypothetical protein DBB42_04710 [Pseudomonas plecoglossicida]
MNDLVVTDALNFSHKLLVTEISDFLISPNRCAKKLRSLIDGGAGEIAESLVPAEDKSKFGIFFTPFEITQRVTESFKQEAKGRKSFFDPACGAGNLLLSIARVYPIGKDFKSTIDIWSKRFGGMDINSSFVNASIVRIIFLAAIRHGLPNISAELLSECVSKFKSFYVGNYLEADAGGEFDCIVANPPYGHTVLEARCDWSSGKTQMAAVFFEKILQNAKVNQKILAILPDVLRSGSRYERWRKMIENNTSLGLIDQYGRFKSDVDVDVFLLKVVSRSKKGSKPIDWISPSRAAALRLSIHFDVSVGSVVPFRLNGDGELVRYITTKNCPPGAIVRDFYTVKFKGRKVSPPFVVVRRTSNPSDTNRLVVSLVGGTQPVAVENHLLIVKPKTGKKEDCIRLKKFLLSADATRQINEKIRCRHLTVTSVRDLDIQKGGFCE